MAKSPLYVVTLPLEVIAALQAAGQHFTATRQDSILHSTVERGVELLDKAHPV